MALLRRGRAFTNSLTIKEGCPVTPLMPVVGLLNERQRLLHDLLVGTVVINNPARARALRLERPPA